MSCRATARSVVMAYVRVWSYWSDEAHRLVDARPVQSASCMLHAASIPCGTFLLTFSACTERAIPFHYMIWLIGARRRIHRLLSLVRDGMFWDRRSGLWDSLVNLLDTVLISLIAVYTADRKLYSNDPDFCLVPACDVTSSLHSVRLSSAVFGLTPYPSSSVRLTCSARLLASMYIMNSW